MSLLIKWGPIPVANNPADASAAESACARSLLSAALGELGFALPITLAKREKGQPYLPQLPHVAVSLAHTHTHAFAAVLVGMPGSMPHIGIDAEPLSSLTSEKARRIASRFFAVGEQTQVLAAPQMLPAFLETFTRKEAFAKYRGDGLAASCHIDTASPDFGAVHGVRFDTRIIDDLCISLCLPADDTAPVIL